MGSGSLKNHGKGKSHEFAVKETNKIVNFLKPSRKILPLFLLNSFQFV